MQNAQLFIKFYLDFIRFNNAFALDNNTLLKKLSNKLIKRLKNSYDTREDFIILKNVKEYLFKLNNNQRANYQFRIFKATFTRTIIELIRKSPTIIITTSITHIIFVIEITYISTMKFK